MVVNDLGGSMRGDGSDDAVADAVVAEITRAGGPMVVCLAGRECGLTHHNYSACAGRFARAFAVCACLGVAPVE